MKLVSVIMSVYNEPIEYIKKSINSILSQTWHNLEFIIIIDNPDNYDVIKFIKNIDDERIKLLINDKNLGLALSLNKALDNSKGYYIARMDADDISYPNRIEKEIFYLENNDLDMVSCLANKIDENDSIWDTIDPFPQGSKAIYKLLKLQNIIIHPTVVIKKDVLIELNGYRNFPSCQDYDLWLRMVSNNYKIGILNEILFNFRRHSQSISVVKRVNQQLNEIYIRRLYKERISNNGNDSFSLDNLKNFYRENSNLNNSFQDKLIMYQDAKKKLKEHNFKTGLTLLMKCLSNNLVRSNIITSIKAKTIKNLYLKKEKNL